MCRRPLFYHRSPTSDHMPVILGFSSAPWASHGFLPQGLCTFCPLCLGQSAPDPHLAAPLSLRLQLKCFPHREAFPEPSPQSAKSSAHLTPPVTPNPISWFVLSLWFVFVAFINITVWNFLFKNGSIVFHCPSPPPACKTLWDRGLCLVRFSIPDA